MTDNYNDKLIKLHKLNEYFMYILFESRLKLLFIILS